MRSSQIHDDTGGRKWSRISVILRCYVSPVSGRLFTPLWRTDIERLGGEDVGGLQRRKNFIASVVLSTVTLLRRWKTSVFSCRVLVFTVSWVSAYSQRDRSDFMTVIWSSCFHFLIRLRRIIMLLVPRFLLLVFLRVQVSCRWVVFPDLLYFFACRSWYCMYCHFCVERARLDLILWVCRHWILIFVCLIWQDFW